MKITNNFSPAFTSTHVQDSKMNKAQSALSSKIINDLTYSEEYQNAKDANIDVYVLPTRKNSRGVNVLLLDKYSDNFVKTFGNKRLAIMGTVEDSPFAIVDKIKENITKVINGEIKRPEQDIERIAEGKTDLMRLRPEKYEEILEFTDDFKKIGMDEQDAKMQAATTYVNLGIKFNDDDDF